MSNDKLSALKYLKEREKELMYELKAIRGTIKSMGGNEDGVIEVKPTILTPILANEKTSHIEPNLSNLSAANLFLHTLKTHDRFMKVREIASFLVSEIGGDEDDWVKKLSRRTNKLKESNRIISIQIGKSKRNFVWGSPKWIDDEGEIKEQYMYDESTITSDRKSSLLDL